ncbi:PQQ-binding-like beta-propeller repeat protein [Streptomyces sp. NPDC057702]|uniref:outer membrane protein assembly factor BamB family protein n=1 Tax=unclassified Streptomyces TaxID=2593676 RepID=UPI0036952117
MSQPPHQPPQGGFGAPQDPHNPPPPGYGDANGGAGHQHGQPGYGYPQQPPTQAAHYGFPQSPPPGQPPQVPPPPGQPAQSPPPPGPPGAPPQFGKAPQSPPPGPPGTPPPAPQSPQTPPAGAGGYGYPQAPTQVGGYGYPQAPTQAGGYGYPTPPGTPYGPGQQAAYGAGPYGQTQAGNHPPHAPFPGAAPGGGDGNRPGKQRMAIIVSAVVAIALVVGGGVWFATKGGDGDDKAKKETGTSQGTSGGEEGEKGEGGVKKRPTPKLVGGNLLAKIPMPKVKEQANSPGLWATDKVWAKGQIDKIVGYPVSGGSSAQYEIPLGGALCWGSTQVTQDGMTAVVFEDGKPTAENKYPDCSEIGLVDLNNGKLVWQRSIKEADEKLEFDEVTIGGGTIAAGGLDGGAAWSMKGDKLWSPQANEECSDYGYGGGPKLVAVRGCGEYGEARMSVQLINPKDGNILSEYKLTDGLDDVHVVSTDPMVIGVDAGDSTGASVSDFMTIDASQRKGKLISKIATGNGKFTAECQTNEVESCSKVVVTKDKLFMATEERRGASETTPQNEIVAYSLTTGKTVGKTDGVPNSSITPLQLDKDGYLVAYQDTTYREGGAVWQIDPTSYEKAKLMQNATATVETESNYSLGHEVFLWANDKLYMGDIYATEPRDYQRGEDLLAMVFGPN